MAGSCDDWDRLAAGTLAGHLLECGSQITGGYFADPPFKNVPGMADLGYPIAEIDADGGMVITKPAGTGGRVDRLHRDRAAALRNSRSLGLSGARRGARCDRRDGRGAGADRVRVTGARGKPAPETLKATVCVDGGVLGEAEISYAGPNAAARARLAAEIIGERMRKRAPGLVFRVDAIGVVSVLGDDGGALARPWASDPPMSGCGSPRNRQSPPRSSFCSTRSRRSIAPARRRCGRAPASHAPARERLVPDRAQVFAAARDDDRSRA